MLSHHLAPPPNSRMGGQGQRFPGERSDLGGERLRAAPSSGESSRLHSIAQVSHREQAGSLKNNKKGQHYAGPSCYFRSETVAGNLNVVGLALPLLDDERQVDLR